MELKSSCIDSAGAHPPVMLWSLFLVWGLLQSLCDKTKRSQ